MSEFYKPLDGKKQLQEMMNDEWIVTDNENYIEIASTKTRDSIASVHGGKTIGEQYDLAGRIAKVPQLERELTAAREELAELKEEYGTWWAQKRIAIDELKEVTEQRDEFHVKIEELAIKLQAVTEQRDVAREECARWRQSFEGHVYVKNEEFAELCEIKRQRDRLADAIVTHRAKAFPLTGEDFDQELWEALQSLNPTKI